MRHEVVARGRQVTAVVRGAPCRVSFDGQVRVVWRGQDAQGDDRIATRAGRVLTWATEQDCRREADLAGWSLDPDQAGDGGVTAGVDLHPAQDWLARRAVRLECGSALDLWNWATDVAASTGQPWRHRGSLRDDCYTKLVAQQVPFMFDLPAYRPQWTPHQVTALRSVLGGAVHVIRAGGWP